MAPCNCGGQVAGRRTVYRVITAGQPPREYSTQMEADADLRRAGKGHVVRTTVERR